MKNTLAKIQEEIKKSEETLLLAKQSVEDTNPMYPDVVVHFRKALTMRAYLDWLRHIQKDYEIMGWYVDSFVNDCLQSMLWIASETPSSIDAAVIREVRLQNLKLKVDFWLALSPIIATESNVAMLPEKAELLLKLKNSF